MDIILAILTVAITCAAAYWLSSKFWGTDYSRTNKSGDFGSPRGGVFATMGGVLLGLVLSFHVLPLLVSDQQIIQYTAIGSMVLGAVAGFIPLFRRKRG